MRRHIAREHRHVVNPKMIPAKFGSKQVLPDHMSKPGPYRGTIVAGDSIELQMERNWLGSCL